MRLYAIVGLCLACLLGGFVGGWQTRAWKAAADDRERAESEAETQRLRAKTVDGAAEKLEGKKAASEIRWRTVVKEVDRVVEKPVYRNLCFDDDGLRLIAHEVAARAPGEPASAVPSAGAAEQH